MTRVETVLVTKLVTWRHSQMQASIYSGREHRVRMALEDKEAKRKINL